MTLPILSLFSGAGGLDLGFEQAGFNVVAAVDIFPSAVRTHNANRSGAKATLGDLSTISAKEITRIISENTGKRKIRGVIAGPPCQAFSRSNVYPRKDDVRRTLPGRFALLLKDLNKSLALDFFVFENVRGLTNSRHREEFEEFRFLFEDAGFELAEDLLNAKHFGVAQDRPRVFIVGFNKDFRQIQHFEFPEPRVEEPKTVGDAFTELFGAQPWPEPTFFRRGLRPDDIPFHPNHWTMNPRSPKFKNGQLKEGEAKGRSFRVLSWSRPSWTVAYGHREIHVHPAGKRRLSILEAMVLQGFPKEYVLHGNLRDQVKLVSDAVPPPLAFELARSIRSAIN